MGFLPEFSFQVLILMFAEPAAFIVGFVVTTYFFFKKKFEDERIFLFHRNLWFLVVLLMSGLIVKIFVLDDDTFYMQPWFFSFLFIAILLVTAIFPATYQNSKKHHKSLAVFPSFCLLTVLTLTLYFTHDLRAWIYREEFAALKVEFEKQRQLDEKINREREAWIERDMAQMGGMLPEEKR